MVHWIWLGLALFGLFIGAEMLGLGVSSTLCPCLPSCLSAFPAARLQFVSLVRMVHWIWLVLALIGIAIGDVLLALGDQANPRTVYHQEESSGLATNYRRHYYTRKEEIGDQGTYSTLVAIGVIILLAGEHCQSLVVQFFLLSTVHLLV
jgi:hypothetical protein